jgi:hypothetical protein
VRYSSDSRPELISIINVLASLYSVHPNIRPRKDVEIIGVIVAVVIELERMQGYSAKF